MAKNRQRQKRHQTEAEQYRPSMSREEWVAEGWEARSIPAAASRRLDTILSILFDPDDAQLLRTATRLSGSTQSEFVRRAAINAAREAVDRGS